MPKTKDAFALCAFDGERILQRRYFKDFHFDGDKTDKEILKSLGASFNSCSRTSEESEKFLGILEKLLEKVNEYQGRIKRHADRLIKYAHAVEYKIATDETANILFLRGQHKRVDLLLIRIFGMRLVSGNIEPVGFNGIVKDDIDELSTKVLNFYLDISKNVNMQYRKVFAERLKKARKKIGLTQSTFAPKIGLTKNGYALYETARRDPSIPTLIRLAKELKISTDWLLGITP